jgi:hypothetical protein
VVSLSALCTGRLYPPGYTPGTHFCWRLSRSQGHSATGRIMSMKNSNDTIGNRTRYLPACNASTNCATVCPHLSYVVNVIEVRQTDGRRDTAFVYGVLRVKHTQTASKMKPVNSLLKCSKCVRVLCCDLTPKRRQLQRDSAYIQGGGQLGCKGVDRRMVM